MLRVRREETANLRIVDTGTAVGRGVFAPKDFASGEVIEVAPVILLEGPFRAMPDALQRVVFNWGRDIDSRPFFAIVLGCGSVYNHSDRPNLRYQADHERQAMVFTTVRPVEYGQQLTISYDQVAEGAPPRRQSWFERNHVEKIDLETSVNCRTVGMETPEVQERQEATSEVSVVAERVDRATFEP